MNKFLIIILSIALFSSLVAGFYNIHILKKAMYANGENCYRYGRLHSYVIQSLNDVDYINTYCNPNKYSEYELIMREKISEVATTVPISLWDN